MTENLRGPRLHGRSKGRPLRKAQAQLVKTLLPQISINPTNPLAGLNGDKPLWLEIGFGGAEHLLHIARRHADKTVFGAEPFLNGVAKALSGIEKDQLDNVRLHHGDVREVTDNLPDACLERVYVLFPDPWPKARHNKRRLLSEDYLAELARLVKPGGQLRFASDIADYVDWVLTRANFSAHWDFQPRNAEAWRTPYDGWPGTRYEAKAKKAGRVCHYLTFTRKS